MPETIKIIYWKGDTHWLGHMQDYPDYVTQGETIEELQENLRDLLKDIESGEIPGVKRVMEIAAK